MNPTIIYHPLPDNSGYLIIHEELESINNELTPTGRWSIYFSPGNCSFYIEPDNDGNWVADEPPSDVTAELIDQVGQRIEQATA